MYDEAKRFSEACTMAYHRERKADTRLIRIFNTYGPRMGPYDGRVVLTLSRQTLNDEPITVFGDGSQTRSLCYVTDLVRGINLVMENDFHEPINLANPEEDPRVRCADIMRAKHIVGWQPTISRKEGFAKMIEHYRDQLVKK